MRLLKVIAGGGFSLLLGWACNSSSDSGDGDLEPLGNLGTGGITSPPQVFEGQEVELEENFRAPVVSGATLWTANPETNRVARIHAETLNVDVMDGGFAPTFLAALPLRGKESGALVLNVLGQDASIFRPADPSGLGGASGAAFAEERVIVQPGASAWAVGRTGSVAIAWSRFEEDLKGPLDGYQDFTVLSLGEDEARSTKLSAGFRPTQVVINEDETRAFVVARPGISVVDLSVDPPRVERELLLPEEEKQSAWDVSFTPDGSLALVRLPRSRDIVVIETETDRRTAIGLPKEVTDLDLSEDGRLAVAVMRGVPTNETPSNGEGGQGGQGALGGPGALGGQGGELGASATDSLVAVFDVSRILDAPDFFELISTRELVGSVVIAGEATTALLYTNAIASTRLVALDLDEMSTRVIELSAPIQAAFVSSDGENSLCVMSSPPGSLQAGAFALVPVTQDLPPRIEGTRTAPRFVALDDDRGILTTWGSETALAETFMGKFPDLSVDRVELSSEPLAGGIVRDARKGYVTEAHPEGRVTFVDLETAEPRTVTGFELSSKVVDE